LILTCKQYTFSFGMHKCSNLPAFKRNGEECTRSAEALRYNKSACVNWNMVRSTLKNFDLYLIIKKFFKYCGLCTYYIYCIWRLFLKTSNFVKHVWAMILNLQIIFCKGALIKNHFDIIKLSIKNNNSWRQRLDCLISSFPFKEKI
jgi:hypothetical protein